MVKRPPLARLAPPPVMAHFWSKRMETNVMRAILAFLLGTAGAAAAPVVHGPPAVTDAVAAAEKSYSDRFANETIAAGMREFIADDGFAFVGSGDPARGPDGAFAAFGGAAPSSARLTWVPREIFAAASGDLAASWGRYTLRDSANAARPPITGSYVTVWQKTAGGAWKAIMDIGNPDAPPPPGPPPRR